MTKKTKRELKKQVALLETVIKDKRDTITYLQKIVAAQEGLKAAGEQAAQYACDECDYGDGPTGWKYNRVEGRYPCVCLTETEAWQELEKRAETKI